MSWRFVVLRSLSLPLASCSQSLGANVGDRPQNFLALYHTLPFVLIDALLSLPQMPQSVKPSNGTARQSGKPRLVSLLL